MIIYYMCNFRTINRLFTFIVLLTRLSLYDILFNPLLSHLLLLYIYHNNLSIENGRGKFYKKEKTFFINKYWSIIFKFSYCSPTKCTKWFMNDVILKIILKIRNEPISSWSFIDFFKNYIHNYRCCTRFFSITIYLD